MDTVTQRASRAEYDEDMLALLAYLTHELRNPLGVLSNSVKALSALDPTEKQCLVLSRMSRQVDELARTLQSLADFSAGALATPAPETYVFAEALDIAVNRANASVAAKRQRLTCTCPEDTVHLRGNRDRVSHALANLLLNASKYTPTGGSISLNAARSAGELEVSVEDDGIGVSADELPHVFELFYRGSKGRQQQKDGAGIGLALVKRFVEADGGSVEAMSDGDGKGSRFVLRLPLQDPGYCC